MPWSYGPSQQRRENRLWRDLKEENRLLFEHNEKLKDENSVLKAQTDQWEAQAGPIIRQRNELQADLASMTEGFMQQRQLAQQLSCEVGQLAQEKVDLAEPFRVSHSGAATPAGPIGSPAGRGCREAGAN